MAEFSKLLQVFFLSFREWMYLVILQCLISGKMGAEAESKNIALKHTSIGSVKDRIRALYN